MYFQPLFRIIATQINITRKTFNIMIEELSEREKNIF